MQTVWRITTARFVATAFAGEGARLYGGRWNPKGFELVYTAESRALALLEMLVQDEALRARYVLIPAQIPEAVRIRSLDIADLPPDWRDLSSRGTLLAMGRAWLDAADSAVLSVPSAVLPQERNFLVNPRHPDFRKIVLGTPQALETDLRLMRGLQV